jgi:hypothetical protein
VAEADLKSLRLVIQQRGTSPVPSYRIIAYGDSNVNRYSDFSSAEILIEALCCAIPDFDVSRLSLNPLGEGQGSMVFVAGMDLDERQLSVLRLS